MKLLVGLGNPGAKYSNNRHNIGFKVMDRIQGSEGFPAFKSKFKAEVTEGRLGGGKVLLMKPQTFMNESGQAVRAAVDFYKIEPENVVVFHDELDLASGKMRIKIGGGHAGHNGLRSIQAHMGTPEFVRVRMGIGHPGHRDAVSPYVLSDFSKGECEGWINDFIDACADQADLLLQGSSEDYMTQVARLAPVPIMNEKD